MKKKVSYNDLALIAGNIFTLYEDGIQLLNIFTLLDELPLRKEYKSLLREMEEVIKEGGSLKSAFSKERETLIPHFFISMVGIGEKTGRIVYVLKGLEIYYKKLEQINKSIIKAITYPIFLMLALIALGIFVLFFFIPNMADIYGAMGKEIPNVYLKVILIKNNFLNNTFLILLETFILGICVPYIVFKFFIKDNLNFLMQKIPIYNLFNEYIIIVLISVIINSGINIAIGLEYCYQGDLNKNIMIGLKKINNDLKNGKLLSQSMIETNMFSKSTLAHIKLGEECGALDKRLTILEDTIFTNLSFKISKITSMIQPFLILFIGVIIIIFIIKFLMPLLDIVLVWNMKKGYTLIELISVIAIIGILMLPTLKLTKSFNNILNKSAAMGFCNELSNMISYGKFYCVKNNSYGEIEINKSAGVVKFKDKKQGGKVIKTIFLPGNFKFSAMYILKINTLGNVESDTIRIFDNYGNVYKVTISTGIDTVNIYEGD